MKAISFDEHLHAHIDKSKCVNCGFARKPAPSGDHQSQRPCEIACKIKAIHKREDGISRSMKASAPVAALVPMPAPSARSWTRAISSNASISPKRSKKGQDARLYGGGPFDLEPIPLCQTPQVITGHQEA
jgi:hypothetical protein